MNYRPFLLAIIFATFVFYFPLAARGAGECSDNGYTTFTINGVGADEDDARLNRNAFRDKFIAVNSSDQFNNEPILVDYLHNPSHLGGVDDWLKSIEQGIFDSENLTDYDLTEMLLAASEKLKTQKVLLVAHSQGNFYANSFYGSVADKDGGIPKESIAVYGVATPSSFVAGDGKYLTSETDKVIAGLVQRIHFREVLAPNTRIELTDGDDPLGHSFSDVYLKYRAPRVIGEIQEVLSGLKADDTRGPDEPCLDPPNLTLSHRIQGVAFAGADTVVNWFGGAVGGAAGFAVDAYTLAKYTVGAASNAAVNLVGGAYDFAQNAFSDALAALKNLAFGFTLTPAGIGPAITNVTGGASTVEQDSSGGGQTSSAAPLSEFVGGVSLADLQNQLDDIAEQLDIISRQILAMAGFPAVLGVSDKIVDEQAEQILEEAMQPTRTVRTVRASGAQNSPPKSIYPQILISEIYDSGTEEFVELFNPNAFAVELSGWYLQKKTQSGSGFDTYASKNLFDGKSIDASDHFLVARSGTGWPGGVDVYTDYSLGPDNTLALKNPNQDIVDKVGWGAAQDFETAPAPSPGANNSIGRKWNGSAEAYQDTDNNSADFEAQIPTSNLINAVFSSQPEETPQTYPKILISEVKAEGASATDEFIEFYNPNDGAVDLSGWALKKKTSGGTESNLVSASAFSGAIPANGYFLVVPQGATTTYPMADLTYSGSTYSFADNNTILFYNPTGAVSDKVGFGQAQDFETNAAENPTAENSIGRTWNVRSLAPHDTDDNSADFELQTPTPKTKNELPENSSPEDSEPEPEPEPAPLPQTVVINESAWMGTKASASDEWLELHNATDESISVAGWHLLSSDGGPDVTFGVNGTAATTTIAAGGFYLLERTDDTTISEPAQWFGSFGNGLSNECETLSLYDASGELIDQTVCSSWPAGDNETKQTMERISASSPGADPANWANNNLFTRNGEDAQGNPINGTPGQQNSVSASETTISGFQLSQLFSEFQTLTLTFFGSPYIVQDGIGIPEGKTLAIESAITVKFNSEKRHPSDPVGALSADGTLKVMGTEVGPVLFTSTAENSFWGCFNFSETSSGSELNYLTVEKSRCGSLSEQARTYNEDSYWAMHVHGAQFSANNLVLKGNGGQAYTHGIHLKDAPPETIIENSQFSEFVYSDNIDAPAAIYIEGGSPVVRDSSFQNNAYGIIIENSSPTLKGNILETNDIPIQMGGNSAPSFSANTANGNAVNGIVVRNWAVLENALWSVDLPYVIWEGASVGRGAVLTVEPGAVIKFKPPNSGGYSGLGVSGSLIARGTLDAPIVFTSIADEYGGDTDNSSVVPVPGVFSISIESDSSIFDNVVVRYGGKQGYNVWGIRYEPVAAVQIIGGSGFILINSVFENNIHHIYWPNSGGACEALGVEGDFNSFDGSGEITCGGNIPFP